MRTVKRAAAIAAILLGACADDDVVCPEEQEIGGLVVDVVWPTDALPAGRYEAIVRADGAEVVAAVERLDGAIPAFPPCECGDEVAVGDEILWIATDTPLDRVLAGYRDPDLGGPAVLELELRYEGATLVRETFAPVYTLVESFTVDCPSRRLRAFATLRVPPRHVVTSPAPDVRHADEP
jgi:hypothetical protein